MSLLPFSYLFNYFYWYGHTNTSFILWAEIQYYRYLFCCSICYSIAHQELLQVGSCAFMTNPHLFKNFSLFFDNRKCSRLLLYFPCPSLRSTHFSLRNDCFYWRMVFRDQDLSTRCTHYY